MKNSFTPARIACIRILRVRRIRNKKDLIRFPILHGGQCLLQIGCGVFTQLEDEEVGLAAVA